jgi:Domain of unknown function (DUF4349)
MSTVDLLRAHAPTAPEELHRRVSLLRPAPHRGRRVRPVLVLAAAAAIAVLAAVVHGFSTSAPQQPQAKRSVPLEGQIKAASGGAATSTTPAFGAYSTDQATRAAAVPAPAAGRLQHTDASIRVRVDNVGSATTRATRVATALGGYAQSVRYRTPQNRAAVSYIELRIPAQNVKRALVQLGGLGTLVSQQISIEDLTNTLERQSAQIAQLRRRVAALQAALRDPSVPDAQRVLLQIKLAEAKRALAQRLHGRKGTLAAGATSRVSLVLENRKHAAAVPHHRGRLGRMLHSAVGFLAIEGIVLLFALIVASPVAIALGLLWFWRRRAVDRLLME